MLRRAFLVSGSLALIAAVALALWPLRGNGVSGNAVAPSYGDFGWFAYEPLPAAPTVAELRRAGVGVPQDVVEDRRRLVAGAAGAGGTLLLGGWLLRRPRWWTPQLR